MICFWVAKSVEPGINTTKGTRLIPPVGFPMLRRYKLTIL